MVEKDYCDVGVFCEFVGVGVEVVDVVLLEYVVIMS